MEDYKKSGICPRRRKKPAADCPNTRNFSQYRSKYCNSNIYLGICADYQRDASVVTPDVIRFILQCLQEDAPEPNQKQHHTTKIIYDRLVTEMGFKGSENN